MLADECFLISEECSLLDILILLVVTGISQANWLFQPSPETHGDGILARNTLIDQIFPNKFIMPTF